MFYDNGGSTGPTLIDLIMQSYALKGTILAEKYFSGLITKEEFRRLLKIEFSNVYTAASQEEQLHVGQIYEKMQAESLSTDTHGHRSVEELNKSGKAFATGIPSSAVICVVMNPEIGIAASHKNLVTIDDVVNSSIQEIVYPGSTGQSINPLSVTTDDRMAIIMEKTVTEAIDEFTNLGPIPNSGTYIGFGGSSQLTERQIKLLTARGTNSLNLHPRLNDGSSGIGYRNFYFENLIGLSRGFIWGGPNHKSYNRMGSYILEFNKSQ